MNPYEILELDKNASIEDIKYKYRQLANKYHPDKGGDTEKFKLINLAYDILTDPIRRQSFDDTGTFFTDTRIVNDAKYKLQELFNTFINPHDPDSQDLIIIMKFELDRRHNYTKERIDAIKKTITKLEKVKSKVKLKKQTENFLVDLLNQSLDQCQRDLQDTIHEEKVFTYLTYILNNYDYSDFDFYEKLPN